MELMLTWAMVMSLSPPEDKCYMMMSVTGAVMSLARPKPAGDRNLGKGKWYSGGSDGAAAVDQRLQKETPVAKKMCRQAKIY